MPATFDEKLQLMIDRQEIEQVLKLYCRAIDRLDVALLKSIYWPEATDDHGSFSGNAHEFADYVTASMKEIVVDGMHAVMQSVIDVDGNFATAKSYYFAYQQTVGGKDAVTAFYGERYAAEQEQAGKIGKGQDFFCGGRYVDLFEKRNGEWKILRRQITNEWNTVSPSPRITDQGLIAQFNLPGRRDRQDPVYLNRMPNQPANTQAR